MAAMKSVLFLASTALVLLHSSSSAFVIPTGSSRVGKRLGVIAPLAHTAAAAAARRAAPRPTPSLQMSAGSADEEEMSSLDKALVAWGVKSPPGEPDIDLKERIKSAGLAGALAYGGTELAFWVISVPLAVVGYHQTTGEWLDLTTLEGKEKASRLFGLTAGFLTFARLVVPLRIALALALTPAMDKYVVKGFLNKGEGAADATE
ncbi:unnamed protein product [Hapterophycus canaliculatus]